MGLNKPGRVTKTILSIQLPDDVVQYLENIESKTDLISRLVRAEIEKEPRKK
jgi:hypothetical protein